MTSHFFISFISSILLFSLFYSSVISDEGEELVGYWEIDDKNWSWFLSNSTFWINRKGMINTGVWSVPQDNYLDLRVRIAGGLIVPTLYKVYENKLYIAEPELAAGIRPTRPEDFEKAIILTSKDLPADGPPGIKFPPPPPDDIGTDKRVIGSWKNESSGFSIIFEKTGNFRGYLGIDVRGKWKATVENHNLDLHVSSPLTFEVPALYNIPIGDPHHIKIVVPNLQDLISGTANRPESLDSTPSYYLERTEIDGTSSSTSTSTGRPTSSTGNIPPPPPPPPTHDDSMLDTDIMVQPNVSQDDSDGNSNTGVIIGVCVGILVVAIFSMILLVVIRRWRDHHYRYQQT